MQAMPMRQDTFEDQEAIEQAAESISLHVKKVNDTEHKFRATAQPGSIEIAVEGISGSIDYIQIDQAFVNSSTYLNILKVAELAHAIFSHATHLHIEDKKVEVSTVGEAIEHIMQHAKKGYNVQRYKGLGEMDPEQLWETTLNPEVRTLIQVTIEDAIEADRLFSMLMGDVVEPRKDFIETNAMLAENVDS